VDWAAVPGALPTHGLGLSFGTRAVDCLVWRGDGKTYCYADLPLRSNPGWPAGSYDVSIGVFSSADGRSDWEFGGIAVHKNVSGSVDSGGLATPSCLARASDGMVFVYFSFEGGPPDYKPVNSLPNGPRGIGIARAAHPLGPFVRLAPAAPAPPWPKNSSWSHGSHPGGILDDSQVLEHAGTFHMFHSRKLSTDTPSCPPSKNGENVCCVEWRTSANAENWTRQGVVLSRAAAEGPRCALRACEPMSARIYNDTLVLLTDGGACPPTPSKLGLVAFTAPAAVLSAHPRKLFAFAPAKQQLLEDYTVFPAGACGLAQHSPATKSSPLSCSSSMQLFLTRQITNRASFPIIMSVYPRERELCAPGDAEERRAADGRGRLPAQRHSRHVPGLPSPQDNRHSPGTKS
jgi:hypothetical protein